MKIVGIDPGISGAIVSLNAETNDFIFHKMPIHENKDINFEAFLEIIYSVGQCHVFLERAVAFALGVTGAFNYGRGFAALEIAIKFSKLPVTYVEPNKWTKEMHQGIETDLKAKAKSIIAVKRLFPGLVDKIPTTKTGKMHEGVVDALLIAGYGARKQF